MRVSLPTLMCRILLQYRVVQLYSPEGSINVNVKSILCVCRGWYWVAQTPVLGVSVRLPELPSVGGRIASFC